MITIILGSILLAYISFPLYKRIIKRIPNKISFYYLLFIYSIYCDTNPFFFSRIRDYTAEILYFSKSLSSEIEKGALFGFGCTSVESKTCSLFNQAEKFSLERLSTFGFDKQRQKLLPIFEEKTTRFILRIPIIIAFTYNLFRSI